jgi:hypothetical protein
MPYCSRCGVEVDEATEACPLCAAPIQRMGDPSPGAGTEPYPQRIIDPENAYNLSKAERRRIGLELISLAAVLVSGALILVDLLVDASLDWSPYAVVSVALAWTLSSAPLALYGRVKTVLAISCAAILAFLLALDALDGELGWSLSLGLPIALASFAALAAATAIMASRSVKGLNLLGIGALVLTVYLIVLESIIKLALGLDPRPYWSLVAAIALVPVAVFLFFVHGRVLHGANLRKFFRL